MTDAEVRDLLNARTHEEVHEKIEALTDSELFAIVMEATKRRRSRKVEAKEVAAYA